MSVFQDYARYYDSLYEEKDYKAECDFLEQVYAKYASGKVATVLDLGCGTGGHAQLLAKRGYRVTGVDRSTQMLAQARSKTAGVSPAPEFTSGDIRSVDLGRTFDAVIAMFAVIGYMTTNEDLLAALKTARRHLKPGGVFVFDAWSGLAVLTERPSDRYKIVERGDDRIIRFVHPELDALQHTVDVHYKVLHLCGNQVAEEVDEVHTMRYLFPQELAHHLTQAGFHVRKLCPFLRLTDDLGERDWNLAVVAAAV
ncbi:MAG: class I SAM-dependent methyltransferase [candidate division WOR-3 bacterium]|nr:class I SAM-dependent methyltransferase [candidate division WOR-3 bacterium]